MKRQYGRLDIFRAVAALMVVAVHTSPLLSVSAAADFWLTRVVCRVAVPFFFMATGFFVLAPAPGGGVRRGAVPRFLKKTGILYAVCVVLYLPVNLYAAHYAGPGAALRFVRDLAFNGTLYHLWYLPAVLLGVPLVAALVRGLGNRGALAVAGALYLFGLGGDSYYGLVSRLPALKAMYDAVLGVLGTTRNGLFFAPLFLLLGRFAATLQPTGAKRPRRAAGLLVLAAVCMAAEAGLLRLYNIPRHDSMYIALPFVMGCLFALLTKMGGRARPALRAGAMLVYVLHPMVIVVLRGAAGVLGLEALLVGNSVVHFVLVCAGSAAAAAVCLWVKSHFFQNRPAAHGAVAEIDCAALRHNIQALQNRLPTGCVLMPALKADGYGHGAVAVAKVLRSAGVHHCCVANVPEGVALRKHGVRGTILVLGFTPVEQLHLVRRFHLTQTILDCAYAQQVDAADAPIRAHIKVDTGMHRLGEDAANLPQIRAMLQMKNLRVEGIYTHLCVCDDTLPEHAAITHGQVERFQTLVRQLQSEGYNLPAHLHSSYGVLNYPCAGMQFARTGVALYGVVDPARAKVQPGEFRPALRLKTQVALLREVPAGQGVGYGLDDAAAGPRRVAMLPIGYADGLPRTLSNGVGRVLVCGQYAPIVGRVCMDQTTIDVTGLPAACGDEVVLIGTQGKRTITVVEVAHRAGTIPNELLSRLGHRLPRVYKNK